MSLAQKIKDPNASKYYGVNWDLALSPGVTITSSTWIITGPDPLLTQDNDSIVAGLRGTQVRLTAGNLGNTYTVTNHIETAPIVEIDDKSFQVTILQQ